MRRPLCATQYKRYLSTLTAILALVLVCSGCKYKVELIPRDSESPPKLRTHGLILWEMSFPAILS
jgi:hypothetical protein